MVNNMNDREGTVINVSRAEFAAGPKRPHTKSELAQGALALVVQLHPEPVEHDAEVTIFPTDYSPELEDDEYIEEMINTDIISSILGQLEVDKQLVDLHELGTDVIELREQGCSDQNILEYVLAYVEHYAPDIHTRAIKALSIKEAREMLVDFLTYSYEHESGTL